jgi:hypothetical protein
MATIIKLASIVWIVVLLGACQTTDNYDEALKSFLKGL